MGMLPVTALLLAAAVPHAGASPDEGAFLCSHLRLVSRRAWPRHQRSAVADRQVGRAHSLHARHRPDARVGCPTSTRSSARPLFSEAQIARTRDATC